MKLEVDEQGRRFAFTTRRRIEFADTDMAGIIHFSRYFVFMEAAEHEFWNAVGTSVHTEIGGQQIGWPRVTSSASFTRPVRFEDEVEIKVRIERLGRKSITWGFCFDHQGKEVARGQITAVCCQLTGDGPRSIAIPSELLERITEAPAEA